MGDVSSINPAASTPMVPVGRPTWGSANAPVSDLGDQVEISDLARILGSLDPEEQARIRAQKVADIREAITNRTYETADKIDYVVSRLMEVIQETPWLDEDAFSG